MQQRKFGWPMRCIASLGPGIANAKSPETVSLFPKYITLLSVKEIEVKFFTLFYFEVVESGHFT